MKIRVDDKPVKPPGYISVNPISPGEGGNTASENEDLLLQYILIRSVSPSVILRGQNARMSERVNNFAVVNKKPHKKQMIPGSCRTLFLVLIPKFDDMSKVKQP